MIIQEIPFFDAPCKENGFLLGRGDSSLSGIDNGSLSDIDNGFLAGIYIRKCFWASISDVDNSSLSGIDNASMLGIDKGSMSGIDNGCVTKSVLYFSLWSVIIWPIWPEQCIVKFHQVKRFRVKKTHWVYFSFIWESFEK